MIRKLFLGFVVSSYLFILTGIAYAVTFTVYNSGVDNEGTLTAIGTPDEHYSLLDPSLNPETACADGNGYGNWVRPLTDGRDAQWITPGCGHGNVIYGHWTYSMTFDLTGLDVETASIIGQWSSDNQGEIFLNGVSTGYSTGTRAFESYHDHKI